MNGTDCNNLETYKPVEKLLLISLLLMCEIQPLSLVSAAGLCGGVLLARAGQGEGSQERDLVMLSEHFAPSSSSSLSTVIVKTVGLSHFSKQVYACGLSSPRVPIKRARRDKRHPHRFP